MNEFENILDVAEKNIKNSEELFAFALCGLEVKPDAKISELLKVIDMFKAYQKLGIPNFSGSSGISKNPMKKSNRVHHKRNNKKRKKSH